MQTIGNHIVDGPEWLATEDSGILYPSLTLTENRPGVDPMASISIFENDSSDVRLLRSVEWNYKKDAHRFTFDQNDWPHVAVEYYVIPKKNPSDYEKALELLDQVLLNAAGASKGGREVGPNEPFGFYRVVRKAIGEMRIEIMYYAPLFPVLDERWISVWKELSLIREMASATQEVEEGYDISPEEIRRALIG